MDVNQFVTDFGRFDCGRMADRVANMMEVWKRRCFDLGDLSRAMKKYADELNAYTKTGKAPPDGIPVEDVHAAALHLYTLSHRAADHLSMADVLVLADEDVEDPPYSRACLADLLPEKYADEATWLDTHDVAHNLTPAEKALAAGYIATVIETCLTFEPPPNKVKRRRLVAAAKAERERVSMLSREATARAA